MESSAISEKINSALSALKAVRWNNDSQVLYDYPSRKANPYFHFAFNSAHIPEATQVTVTLLSKDSSFKVKEDTVAGLHITSLGVFPIEGFAQFLESLTSAKPLE